MLERLIAHYDMSWRTCSPNSAPAAAGFRRTVGNGGKRATILGSAMRNVATICHSQRLTRDADSSTAAPSARETSRVSGGFAIPSRAWPVAALILAATSIPVSGYDWLKTAERLDSPDSLKTGPALGSARVTRVWPARLAMANFS
jgi:hypothetical protein